MSGLCCHEKFTEKDFFKDFAFLLLCHLPPFSLSPPRLTFLLLHLLLSLSPTKRLLIEHPALSFKLQGAYTVHLKGGRSWRYQEAFENVLCTARGYKDAGCPKNNNKGASDRFVAFCISADALQLKLAPQIICWLNTSRTMRCEEKKKKAARTFEKHLSHIFSCFFHTWCQQKSHYFYTKKVQ